MRKKNLYGFFALVGLGTLAVVGSGLDFVSQTMRSVQYDSAVEVSSPASTPEDLRAKLGIPERRARKQESRAADGPETVLWYVVFDFVRQLEIKAAESIRQGKNGNIYSKYFTRQGPLSPENDSILKQTAARYFGDVNPINERARNIIEDARAHALPEPRDELKKLQTQKDEATLRYRDKIRVDFGEEAFNAFLLFLNTDFSEGSTKGRLAAPNSPQDIYYEWYVWIIWDESEAPTLITGFSELYFYFFGSGFSYDPSLDSFFVNTTTSTLLDAGRGDGYRDWFPAQYFHPVFVSATGNRYCTLADYYAILYDGPFPVDEIYLTSDSVCHTAGPPPTPTPTPTPNVTSVTFSQVTPSTEPISQNPQVLPHNPGIGQRIFPDDDTPQDSVDRRLVRVTATLSRPVPNVPVYFRNFDLDDPAADPVIDPNGATGNDNNGMPIAGQLLFANGCGANGASVFCPTDANGVATIDFVVTRQPGDNFAIAASTSPAEANAVNVNGIELTNASGANIPMNCPTEPVCRSQMLTVWRRLHIEVDSMGVASGNRATGFIRESVRFRFGETRTVLLNGVVLEPNRFEGGVLISNGWTYDVICNLAAGQTCNTADTVNVRPRGAAISLSANAPFELYDDDDFNDDDGANLNGDTGDNITEPDTALLTANSDNTNTNVYVAAYVRPVYDVNDPRDDNDFRANTDGSAAADIRQLFVSGRDLTNTDRDDEFWTIYLLGAYQHTVEEDNDSSVEPCPIPGVAHCYTLGIVDAITLVTDDLEGSGALIFTEIHRPREIPGYTSNPTNLNSMAVTVAHEVGHLFSCEHGDGGLLGTDPNTGMPVSNQLSPTMIFKIRGLTHP